MKNKYILIATLVALFATVSASAQEGFGTNTPAPSSVVDMVSTNKGALLPRVALTSVTDVATILAPANALTVFNTATTTTGTNDVTPGYYYYSTAVSKWIRLLDVNTGADLTDDAWINKPANGRIELGWLSDGITPRTSQKLRFRIKDTNQLQMGDGTGSGDDTQGRLNIHNQQDDTDNIPDVNKFESAIVGISDLRHTATNVFGLYSGGTFINRVGGIANYNAPVTTAFDLAGVRAEVQGDKGTINRAMGVYTKITDSKYIAGQPLTSAITNGYGLYIDFVSAINKWSLYATDAAAPSYLAGSLGIGTTAGVSPTNQLHVKATTNPVRFEGLQTGSSSDLHVVVDATGVLKTIPTATVTSTNIYNSDGVLNSNRNVDTKGQSLQFTNSLSPGTMFYLAAQDTQTNIAVQNNTRARLALIAGTAHTTFIQDINGAAEILSTGSTTKMSIGTSASNAPVNLVSNGNVVLTGTSNGNVGIGVLLPATPTNKLHVIATANPVRFEGLQAGSSSDQIVVADATGVLKTVASVTATPKFFYAPSVVLPTVNTSLPANITYNSGTQVFTADLYAIYNNQFGMTGDIAGAGRSAIKSAGATTLPVQAVASLEYFVTYFDNTVFDPTTINLSATGVLTYKVLPAAVVSEKTYMNIVFKVK